MRESGVDRTSFYGNRPYAHVRVEFENRLQHLHEAGQYPDPKIAQINRLKTENSKLKERLAQAEQNIEELTDFRSQALVRLAAGTTRSTASSGWPITHEYDVCQSLSQNRAIRWVNPRYCDNRPVFAQSGRSFKSAGP